MDRCQRLRGQEGRRRRKMLSSVNDGGIRNWMYRKVKWLAVLVISVSVG